MYEQFSREDFIADEYFIKWVREPDEESVRFWNEWLASHPEKASVIEEARRIVVLVWGIDFISPPDEKVTAMKRAIDRRIQDLRRLRVVSLKNHWATQAGASPVRSQARLKIIMRYAAVLAAILVLSASLYVFREIAGRPVRHMTGYGETQTLTLPDGSKVILNANSSISYAKDWRKSEKREVWLEGEAFFSVERGETLRKFIVYANRLQVEVLGTKFNVNNRERNTRVVLSSGKIQLKVPELGDTASIVMNPGELVEYTQGDAKLVSVPVHAQRYISWINNEWILENTSLREICETLEDNFGITVILLDEELAKRTITASLPAGDLDFILKALSETLGLSITERQEHIYIIKNNLDQ